MWNMRANSTALALVIAVLAGGASADAPLAERLPAPLTDGDFLVVGAAEARLGQLLFYDPILSGNRNISCSTCHHPTLGTSDGLPLGMGEGGVGLGPERVGDAANAPEARVPRNAPALYNLGALEYRAMFHDGRVEQRADGSLRVPIEDPFFDEVSGILATQAAFPVLSPDEMAGHVSENDISKAVRKGRFSDTGGAWDLIAGRVAAIPDYVAMFAEAYPETAERSIRFADISNAIAAFMAFEFRATDSAFDRHLRGEAELTGEALAGADLFYGEAGCSACHAGALQTDHDFHAMGQPQFGPGKTLPFERGTEDLGRYLVTGQAVDLYAFRTPSLRNVTLTAPYGHTGAYDDLWEFVSDHATPRAALAAWDRARVEMPAVTDINGKGDWDAMDDPRVTEAIANAVTVEERALAAHEVDALVAFLSALEDDPSRLGIPDAVPSGLPFEK